MEDKTSDQHNLQPIDVENNTKGHFKLLEVKNTPKKKGKAVADAHSADKTNE